MPCSYRVNMYLCSRIGSDLSGRASGLKGNRVKVPDSPAAVKLHIQLFGKHSCHWRKEAPGRFRKGSQSEDLPSFKPARSPGIGRAADRLSTTKKDIADIAERRAQSPCMYATSARTPGNRSLCRDGYTPAQAGRLHARCGVRIFLSEPI